MACAYCIIECVSTKLYCYDGGAGDVVVITEQTLEGNYFVVHNKRSGQSGKVPVDYIEISQSLSL